MEKNQYMGWPMPPIPSLKLYFPKPIGCKVQVMFDQFNSGSKSWDLSPISSHISSLKNLRFLRFPSVCLSWKTPLFGTLNKTVYFQWNQLMHYLQNPPHLHCNLCQSLNVYRRNFGILKTPKVRNFLWRACKNAWPIRVGLRERSLLVDELCPLCKNFEETTEHCIICFPITRGVHLTLVRELTQIT